MSTVEEKTMIIGAGPAGMGCAYTLTKSGRHCLVIDGYSQPGGLCRTLDFQGYLFDIGGHRFLTSVEEIQKLWQDLMEEDLLKVERLSRIYYRRRYFSYPLNFMNTVLNLGLWESFLCFMSFYRYKLFPYHEQRSFEGWIINHFGKRLYEIFFKTYTEKVWAMPCKDLSSDWAVQRIRGLSLKVALKNMLSLDKKNSPKTLAERFYYPKTGPGEFYRRLQKDISLGGSGFKFNTKAVKIKHDGGKVVSVVTRGRREADREETKVEQLFSSMPLPEAVKMFDPAPSADVIKAAENLSFRSFLVVNVILDTKDAFPDQWIYVHSPEVRMGRIQNYKNWSPAMVPDEKKTSLGLEYFCCENDGLWKMNDLDLINYALSELETLGIVSRRHFINGFVVRYENAYPVYSMGYEDNVKTIRDYLAGFPNFQTIGRAGIFRYDNSDHSLLTGIYAARNFLGQGDYDLTKVNVDGKYLES